MAEDAYDVAALIGSRICHDLISPLGAISNGVELLSMGTSGESDEISLISDSVTNANARVKFFRIAFGAADPIAVVGPAELAGILDDLAMTSRTEIIWLIPGEMQRDTAKLFFLLIMCLETAMPFGGQIRAAEDGDGWRLSGRAEKLKLEPDLWKLLSVTGHWAMANDTKIAPAQVQFLLAADMLSSRSKTAHIDTGDAEISIAF